MFAIKILLTGSFALLFGCTAHHHADVAAVSKKADNLIEVTDDAVAQIKLTAVSLDDFPEVMSVMGRINVQENKVTVIPSRVGGRVESVQVSTGEKVTVGQVLAVLLSPDFAVAREEYVQAFSQAQNNPSDESRRLLHFTQQKLESIGLGERDLSSLSESEQGDPNTVARFKVRASLNGVVLDKKITPGTVVNVGDTLFSLGAMDKVWFAGDIYPEDLGKVHLNQDVVIGPLDSGATLTGKISFISPVVDSTTRTIKVRALVENPKLELRGDMYMDGKIVINKRKALVIPTQSIVTVGNETYCFRQTAPKQFERIKITSGSEQNKLTEVKTGLQANDMVVSDGSLLLEAVLENASAS